MLARTRAAQDGVAPADGLAVGDAGSVVGAGVGADLVVGEAAQGVLAGPAVGPQPEASRTATNRPATERRTHREREVVRLPTG